MRLANLVERVDTMEGEISEALNSLAKGLADNLGQVWDNQRELAKALAELSDDITVVVNGERDEKAASSRPVLQPEE